MIAHIARFEPARDHVEQVLDFVRTLGTPSAAQTKDRR